MYGSRIGHLGKKGFTLMELMIVISIIMILFGVGVFPYMYYLERGYTERASDGIAQEWVLAHKAVRNGIVFNKTAIAPTNAYIALVFEKYATEVQSYIVSNGDTFDLNNIPPADTSEIRKYKKFILENGVQILGFTGSLDEHANKVIYKIKPIETAPYTRGTFIDSLGGELSLTGAEIIVGYPEAVLETGRARRVLLRPYLQ